MSDADSIRWEMDDARRGDGERPRTEDAVNGAECPFGATAQPVIGYHLVLSAYGLSLPNDSRGSWSDEVRAEALQAFGPTTKTGVTRSVAGRSHDRSQRAAAKRALVRPAVEFNERQCQAIALGFGDYFIKSELQAYACCVLPRHAHLVIGPSKLRIEQVANLLKGAATAKLMDRQLHPFATSVYRNGRLPSPWARNEWKRFLFTPADVRQCVTYVQDNPLKEGKPRQRWRFVVPYRA